MKVSVVTPTYGRAHCLPGLIRCFQAQTWPDKELLIMDDSPAPAPGMDLVMQSDPRIRYLYSPTRHHMGMKVEDRARVAEM